MADPAVFAGMRTIIDDVLDDLTPITSAPRAFLNLEPPGVGNTEEPDKGA